MDTFDHTPLPSTWNEMLRRYHDAGWDATLLTFMFAHMPGGRLAIQAQQRADVEKIYNLLLTRIVRNTRRRSSAGRLPIWLCSPDFPVFKHAKQVLSDVTINDGQHVHAHTLVPPGNRLREKSLAQLVVEEYEMLIARTRCVRIDAQPITHDEAKVLRYTRKSEERGWIDADAFFVLPRTLDEVRDGPVRVGRQSSIFGPAPKVRKIVKK